MLEKGTLLWRVYRRGGNHPGKWHAFRSYGPLKSMRFDHHEKPPHVQSRGILYGALQIDTCLAEVYQESRTVVLGREDPWLAAFELERDVTLLDLRGTWPTAAGASMAMNSGQRARARRWSRRIYEDYPGIEGLWYASSMHANQPAIALYERAADCIPDWPAFHRPLDDPALGGLLAAMARRLGYVVV